MIFLSMIDWRVVFNLLRQFLDRDEGIVQTNREIELLSEVIDCP